MIVTVGFPRSGTLFVWELVFCALSGLLLVWVVCFLLLVRFGSGLVLGVLIVFALASLFVCGFSFVVMFAVCFDLLTCCSVLGL